MMRKLPYMKTWIHLGKSYFLTGREDNINSVIKNKKVIYTDNFGSTKLLAYMEN